MHTRARTVRGWKDAGWPGLCSVPGVPLLRPPVHPGLPAHPTRAVRCYHCARGLDVPARAITLSCPHCYKAIHVRDVVVEGAHAAAQVFSCGVVVVGERGCLKASAVTASLGVSVLGRLEAHVRTHGPVVIGPSAVWAGDCAAANIIIRPGARILSGRFSILGAEPSHAHAPPRRSARAPRPPAPPRN